jgi:hypothetical protein
LRRGSLHLSTHRRNYFSVQQLALAPVAQQSQAQPTQAQLPGEQPWSQAQTSHAQFAPQQQLDLAVVSALPAKRDINPTRIKLKIDIVWLQIRKCLMAKRLATIEKVALKVFDRRAVAREH